MGSSAANSAFTLIPRSANAGPLIKATPISGNTTASASPTSATLISWLVKSRASAVRNDRDLSALIPALSAPSLYVARNRPVCRPLSPRASAASNIASMPLVSALTVDCVEVRPARAALLRGFLAGMNCSSHWNGEQPASIQSAAAMTTKRRCGGEGGVTPPSRHASLRAPLFDRLLFHRRNVKRTRVLCVDDWV